MSEKIDDSIGRVKDNNDAGFGVPEHENNNNGISKEEFDERIRKVIEGERRYGYNCDAGI